MPLPSARQAQGASIWCKKQNKSALIPSLGRRLPIHQVFWLGTGIANGIKQEPAKVQDKGVPTRSNTGTK